MITILYTYRSCLSEARLLRRRLQQTEISFLHWLRTKVRDLLRLIQTPRYQTEERCNLGVRVTDESPVVKVIGAGEETPLELVIMVSLAVVIKSALKSFTKMLVKEKNSFEIVRIEAMFCSESEIQLVSSIYASAEMLIDSVVMLVGSYRF